MQMHREKKKKSGTRHLTLTTGVKMVVIGGWGGLLGWRKELMMALAFIRSV